jgi:putative ABC transport system ATP-binding protein
MFIRYPKEKCDMPIVSLKNINKSFKDKVIFKDFSLDVEEGEFLSITGASGKGKTTLLNIIGLLEKPDSGDVLLFDTKNESFGSRKARDIRRHKLSYLFQNFGLVDNETCKFNLNLALEFSDYNREQKREAISDALTKVGLEGFDNRKVYSLSGGEQQRVALAKILLKSPELILADEPTGSLDADNRDFVLSLLKEFNEDGKTIIMVTHDVKVDSCAKRHICL